MLFNVLNNRCKGSEVGPKKVKGSEVASKSNGLALIHDEGLDLRRHIGAIACHVFLVVR